MVMSWVASQSCLSILTCRLSSVTNTETRMQLWLHLCSQFGLLCKRATMLCNTKNRLSHLVKWFSYLSQLGCVGLTFQWGDICRKAGLAACLHGLSLGWDESEFEAIISLLENKFPVMRQLGQRNLGLYSKQASKVREVSQLRALLRIFLWDFAPDEMTQSSWLAFVMKRFVNCNSGDVNDNSTAYYYSTFLSFMLGSTRDFHQSSFQQSVVDRLFKLPDMFLLEEEVFTNNYTETKQTFGDLGKALRVLNTNISSSVLGISLYNLMESLFQSWEGDNMAACLLFSSEDVVTQYLVGLLPSGKEQLGLEKIAEILVSMLVVCEKLGNSINQGLHNILDFAFTKLTGREVISKTLVTLFWREVGERLEDDMGLDVLVQLGVHMGLKGYHSNMDKISGTLYEIEE